MNLDDFEIKIIRQHWIKDNGLDDRHDLCSHGEVFIRIGQEIISNEDSGSWALSAAGLYLLRSLEQDCEFDQFSNQLVPCCGHFIIPNDNGENFVTIIGCPNGVDWKIKHVDKWVTFESIKGNTGQLSFEAYKRMIIHFTNEIETFYGDPKLKVIPEEEFDRLGFEQFWSEWVSLKRKWI